jgi:hypothetical protein
MHCIAPSSRQCARPTALKTTEFVTNNNMVISPHPLYSMDSAPLFFFVSQIENETEGTFWNCLTSKGNHKRYSIALWKITSTVLLKCGENDGITVYIMKEMAAKNE